MPGSEGSDTEGIAHSDSDGLEVVRVVARSNQEGRPEEEAGQAELELVLHPEEAERLSKAGLPEIKKFVEASRQGRAQRVRPPHVVIWGSLEETKVRRWRLCDARNPRSSRRSWKFRHGKAHNNLPKWNAKLILHGK